jgi:DNA-binding CsgD family transcriptional regulator
MSVRTDAMERRLVNLVGDAYGFADLDEFRHGILGLMHQAVPNDYAAYNEVDDDPEQMIGISQPVLPADLPLRWARLAHQHPVLAYVRRTRDGRPRRISDFVDHETFRQTALYREIYAPIGVASQVAFTLPSRAPVVVGIALSRGPEDFTDAECSLLAEARPHLIQAYRTIELSSARAATLAALERGLDAAANPVLVVDSHGRVAFATEAARRLLADRLELDEQFQRLPRALVDALARRGARAGGVPSTEPLLLGAGERALTARVLPGADGDGTTILLLEPGTGGMSATALRGLGLTRRQAEALRWIALGRSGPEAAELMGISPRTVEKHLQLVHEKLGVATSSQAAATAWAAVGVRHPRSL